METMNSCYGMRMQMDPMHPISHGGQTSLAEPLGRSHHWPVAIFRSLDGNGGAWAFPIRIREGRGRMDFRSAESSECPSPSRICVLALKDVCGEGGREVTLAIAASSGMGRRFLLFGFDILLTACSEW